MALRSSVYPTDLEISGRAFTFLAGPHISQVQPSRCTVTDFLRLAALDEDDLKVISACLQDSVVRVGDIEFLATEHRFLMAVNRFAWEKPGRWPRRRYERHRAILHFDQVHSVARNGIDQSRPDDTLVLLAAIFTPTDEPAGTVDLHFSGGATLRLEVDCIEARLTDLGSAWETRHKPVHLT